MVSTNYSCNSDHKIIHIRYKYIRACKKKWQSYNLTLIAAMQLCFTGLYLKLCIYRFNNLPKYRLTSLFRETCIDELHYTLFNTCFIWLLIIVKCIVGTKEEKCISRGFKCISGRCTIGPCNRTWESEEYRGCTWQGQNRTIFCRCCKFWIISKLNFNHDYVYIDPISTVLKIGNWQCILFSIVQTEACNALQ